MWTNDQINNLSWSSNFFGSYNSSLNLNRSLGTFTSLPTNLDVNSVITETSFTGFRTNLEFTGPNLHSRPHVWVGGVMANVLISPIDPIFYLHHSMIDKIWQQWSENGNPSLFSDNNMPTFDGTVSGFNYVDPQIIVDSRTLGIFYSDAANELTKLIGYSVTNNRVPVENFHYTYDIEVQYFSIPSNKKANITSGRSITILSDFEAALGSTFNMYIVN